jgi:hypothetical protein
MTTLIRILAVLCAVAVIGCWYSFGAHMGWTHTVVPVKESDLVAEMESTEYESRFIPGVDFLVAGLIGAAAIFALSLTAPKLKKLNSEA